MANIKFTDEQISKIKNLLKNTTGYQLDKKATKNWNNRTEFGYHSFQIGNLNIEGQRNPVKRLKVLRKYINFKNKNVIDLGCNVGGMLLHLDEIKEGYGFDYDKKVIYAAKEISKIINSPLTFEIADLNNFDFNIISKKFDFNSSIIFLLSLGSWLNNWKKLYKKAHHTGGTIILEVNNQIEGSAQIEFFRNLGRNPILISELSKDDHTDNINRQCYLMHPVKNKDKFLNNSSNYLDKIPWEDIYVRYKVSFPSTYIKNITQNSIYIAPFHYINIQSSMHLKALNEDNFKDYDCYVEDNFQSEHHSKNFKSLLVAFSIQQMEKLKLLKMGKSYIVLDGVHRLSIIYFKNLFPEGIPLNIVQIFENETLYSKSLRKYKKSPLLSIKKFLLRLFR